MRYPNPRFRCLSMVLEMQCNISSNIFKKYARKLKCVRSIRHCLWRHHKKIRAQVHVGTTSWYSIALGCKEESKCLFKCGLLKTISVNSNSCYRTVNHWHPREERGLGNQDLREEGTGILVAGSSRIEMS